MQSKSLAIASLGIAVSVIGTFLFLNFYGVPSEAWLLKGGMVLSSAAFSNGTAIPQEYTCNGTNLSPPLAWAGQPSSTVSLALIMEDPDAQSGLFTHWVLFNIPPDLLSLGSSQPSDNTIDGMAIQGKNDFGVIGYKGPCPPAGSTHHYRILVFALNTSVNLPPGSTRADLLRAIMGHVVASGTLIGTYG